MILKDIYSIDDKKTIEELKTIENNINEELSKDTVDKEKLYKLRFQQLMKGIYLTQNVGMF